MCLKFKYLIFNIIKNAMGKVSILVKVLICAVLLVIIHKSKYKTYDVTGTAKKVISKTTTVQNTYSDMRNIVKEFYKDKNWDNVVEIGEIYAKGVYPFLRPEKKMALVCFETASRCPDRIVAGNAKMKISELIEDSIDEQDQEGNNMNVSYGNQIVKMAEEFIKQHDELAIKNNKNNLENQPFFRKEGNNQTQHVNPLPNIDLDTIGQRNYEMRQANNKRQEELLRPRPLPPAPRARARALNNIGGGAQSAHDHGVTTSTKYNIASLIKEFKGKNQTFRNNEKVLGEVKEMCRKFRNDPHSIGLTSKILKNAVEVSNSLGLHTKDLNGEEILYSDTGVSQVNILDMVLWKIKNIQDKELKNNVQETLCKRLADGKQGELLVCGTGKISRIVSVFEGVLEDKRKCVSLKLVEKEIAQLASKVREDFLNTVTEMGRSAYESVNSVPEYTEKMKNIFLDEVNKEYIQKLKMSPSILKNITDVYVEAF